MRYAKIEDCEYVNGDGIGVSLYVQGCPIHCKGCFNSDTWDFDGGEEWTEKIQDQFLNLIDKPYIKRVSILGGEPLADENISDVTKLIYAIRNKFGDSKEIWLFTGYVMEYVKHVDVVVTGPFIEELKDLTLQFRGSTNQRVIDMKKTREKGEVVLWTN